MPDYRVSWEIDVEADNPVDAARKAWNLARGQASTANVFTVSDQPVTVDLSAEDDDG